MAWWLLAVPVLYVAKKALDAIAEDSGSGDSNARTSITLEKAKRTRARKQAVRRAIVGHRKTLTDGLASADSLAIDEVRNTSAGKFTVSLTGISAAIGTLNEIGSLFSPDASVTQIDVTPRKIMVSFEPVEDVVEAVVEKAKLDYGESHGFDAYDCYDEDRDEFLRRLTGISRHF